jgi:hypothetical protein
LIFIFDHVFYENSTGKFPEFHHCTLYSPFATSDVSKLVKTHFKNGAFSYNQEVTTEEINGWNISHFTEAYTEILSTREHKLTCKDV